jgi:hypothetical protein
MDIHPDSPVRRATLEVESHVGDAGWDQPPRLFALVDTRRLMAENPDLAQALSLGNEFTPVEQENLPEGDFEEVLTQIAWPESVDGVAAVVERLMLPPQAEADLPDDAQAALVIAQSHPERRDVRIAAAVLRDGSVHSAVRGRLGDELLEGTGLVPGLIEVLRGTLT